MLSLGYSSYGTSPSPCTIHPLSPTPSNPSSNPSRRPRLPHRALPLHQARLRAHQSHPPEQHHPLSPQRHIPPRTPRPAPHPLRPPRPLPHRSLQHSRNRLPPPPLHKTANHSLQPRLQPRRPTGLDRREAARLVRRVPLDGRRDPDLGLGGVVLDRGAGSGGAVVL